MNTMKNTLQLHLENFQAISDMDLAFDEGINIIAGQSNSSKTSILRAIEVLLRNQSGSADFIKYGEKECLVNMKYLGNDITWSRTKKDIVYEINGEKYLKVGNTDLFHLLERNGFVIDPQDELSNLEDEWTLPFPFYKSSSELFKLFENIFSVSDSAKILKAMKEDEDSCKKQLLEVENELNRTKRKIEAISELHIEDTVQELAKYKEQLTVLNKDKEDLLDSLALLAKLCIQLKSYKNLPKKVQINTGIINEYKEGVSNLKKLHNLVEIYKVLKNIPKNKIKVNTELLAEIVDIKEDLDKLYNLQKLSTLNIPKVPSEQPDYDSYISHLIDMRKDYNTLKELYTRGRALAEKRKVLIANVSKLKMEIEKIKVCPLCGQEINGDLNHVRF